MATDRQMNSHRRQFMKTIGVAGTAGTMLALSGCSSAVLNGDDEDYPGSSMTMVIPTGEGGGQDTSARGVGPYFEDAIGTNLDFDYRPGASHQVGTQSVIAGEPDGNTIMTTNAPNQQVNVLGDDAAYELDDLAPIGNLETDAGIMRANEGDDRFDDVAEFIEYAQENPGELTVSTSHPDGRNVLTLALMREQHGADFSIIPYDGGSDARTAMLQGEVDATHSNVFVATDLIGQSKTLCVHAEENEWPEYTDDAPTYNEVMDEEIPDQAAEVRYFWATSAQVGEEYPDRLETLQDAFEEAATSDEYLDDLASGDVDTSSQVDYMDPEETEEANQELLEFIEEYQELMDGAT